MKLVMLGTGNAPVTACYNTCFVISDADRFLLVDGGGGNTLLAQLKRAGIDWKNLREVFVTHKHIDHLLGIVWLMRMICQNMRRGTYEGEVTIYGHDEVVAILRDLASTLLAAKDAAYIDDRVHLVVVRDGESRELIGHTVTFFDIASTKAKQFGFQMALEGGETLCCCGDEPYNEREEPYAAGATWLLHEAFCLHGQAEVFRPYEKHHSTVKDACELAERLGVKNLVLYHTEDANIEHRRELYTAEGSAYYHGNLIVPNDLDVIDL